MDASAIAEIVRHYVAAWNEADAAARSKLLQQCWAEGGTYVDPSVQLTGREALAAHIAKIQSGRPDARINS